MIPRCRSFRSIFAERAPKNIVSCSLVHERNRYELATVQRYGHKNGASRFHMNRRCANDVTSIRDENAARHFHKKNAVKAMPLSACPHSHSHALQVIFRWHCAFVNLTGSTFVAKWRCASMASSLLGLILDQHRVSGALITKGEIS